MRIAFLSHQWPGARMGGIGAAVRHTAAALADAGHDVHVFTLDLPDDARANVPPRVHLHETAPLAARLSTARLAPDLAAPIHAGGEATYRLSIGWLLCADLLAQHHRQPFDIIEAPEVDALALPLLFNNHFTTPVVTHLHCATAIAHLGNDTPLTDDDRLIHATEFAAIALADARCAPTQAVVDLTRRFMPIDDVTILPHPIAGESRQLSVASGHSSPHATCCLPPAARVSSNAILFFGRIERLKGVEPLAHALNRFLPRNPDATFRFIGPDTPTAPGRRSMRQHLLDILHPDLHPRVDFPGELAQPQLQHELARCRFCVLPSLHENFSMAVCEALAAGKPVIVADGTGSPEVIGDAGLIARRGDADHLAEQIERLYRDDDLQRTLAEKAHRRATVDLAPATIAARRIAFYQQVIDRHAHAPRRSVTDALAVLPPESHAAFLRALVALTGALSGVATPRTPGIRLLAIMQRLAAATGKPAQVVLYGAGKHTQRLLSERALWERHGHRVIGLIDDHPRFADNPTFLDLPVRSLAATLASLPPDHPPVVLSTDTYQDQFWCQTAPLRTHHIPVFPLYD